MSERLAKYVKRTGVKRNVAVPYKKWTPELRQPCPSSTFRYSLQIGLARHFTANCQSRFDGRLRDRRQTEYKLEPLF